MAAPVLKWLLRDGRLLGELEQYFVNGLLPGDSFIFAGQLLAFEGLRENDVVVSRAAGGDPKVPAYAGGRLPLSAHLAERVRDILEHPEAGHDLPPAVGEWLRLQRSEEHTSELQSLMR